METGADGVPGAHVVRPANKGSNGEAENVTHQRRSTMEKHVLVNLSR